MKKLKASIIALLSLAATSASAQFGAGMRDNRFIYGDFTFLNHYEVKLEHSIFAEKLGYQYLRAYAGYKGDVGHRSFKLEYKAQAYFGAAYNRSYYSGGALIQARCTLFRRLIIDGRLNPHYDSGNRYETCFYAGAGAVITRHIDILAGYTTIPEYRISERRVHLGFDVHVGQLSVNPALSVAADGASRAKTLRVLAAFRYQF